MKNIITEILKCSGRSDLAKETICGLAVGYEKKKEQKTAQRDQKIENMEYRLSDMEKSDL